MFYKLTIPAGADQRTAGLAFQNGGFPTVPGNNNTFLLNVSTAADAARAVALFPGTTSTLLTTRTFTALYTRKQTLRGVQVGAFSTRMEVPVGFDLKKNLSVRGIKTGLSPQITTSSFATGTLTATYSEIGTPRQCPPSCDITADADELCVCCYGSFNQDDPDNDVLFACQFVDGI
jgi:hypothetical protein